MDLHLIYSTWMRLVQLLQRSRLRRHRGHGKRSWLACNCGDKWTLRITR